MSGVLVLTGLIAVAIGSWRGYGAVRVALGPLIQEGDPTRTLIEAGRPVYLRSRVRAAIRHIGLAIGWLAIAMYGLFLVSVGMSAPA